MESRGRVTLSTLAVALALAATGCGASGTALVGPRDGGRRWTSFASEHVLLETDVDRSDAQRKLASFERMHDALSQAMRAAPKGSGPRVEVVMFSELADFYVFAGKNRTAGGYFMKQAPGDLEPHPVLVMPDVEVADETRMLFQHELAHRFIHQRFVSLPRWLNEGLAQYFSSVDARPEGLVVGSPCESDFWARPYASLVWVGQAQQINIPLFRAPRASTLSETSDAAFYAASSKKEGEDVANEDRERQTANYTGAWRLVHFLLQEAPAEDRARFAAYLGALERGEKDTLLAHFGADAAGLDARFASYLSEPPTRITMSGAVSAREPEVRVADLSDADVHVLWSRIAPMGARPAGDAHAEFRGKDTLAIVEAEKAVLTESGSAAAHYQAGVVLFQEKRNDEAKVHFDEALRQSPHDPRYLFAKIALLERTGARVPEELVDELARTATSGMQLQAAAELVAKRRLADALVLAARAAAADPQCWRCQRARADVLSRSGAVEDALVAIDRAITLAPEGGTVAAALLRDREKIAAMKPR